MDFGFFGQALVRPNGVIEIMSNKLKSFLFLVLCSIAGIANSAEGYKCKILMAHGLSDDGRMIETNFSNLYVGREFVVDRGTGRITGKISNHNAYGEPKVLDRGSKAQAYKVITIYKPMTTIAYLYIKEFADGSEKPFMFVDGSNIISGICGHY